MDSLNVRSTSRPVPQPAVQSTSISGNVPQARMIGYDQPSTQVWAQPAAIEVIFDTSGKRPRKRKRSKGRTASKLEFESKTAESTAASATLASNFSYPDYTDRQESCYERSGQGFNAAVSKHILPTGVESGLRTEQDHCEGSYPKEHIVCSTHGAQEAINDQKTTVGTAADPRPWYAKQWPSQPSTTCSVSGTSGQTNQRTAEGREVEGATRRAEETERRMAELERQSLAALERARTAEQRILTAEWERGRADSRVEVAERHANAAKEEADGAHKAKEAAEEARLKQVEQYRKALASAKHWGIQKEQEILAAIARAEEAERNRTEMEKWVQQRVHEEKEATAIALEQAKLAQREKNEAVNRSEEAERNKASLEERVRKAEQGMMEAFELAKDSAYRAQKAERDLAAEVKRARGIERELLGRLKLTHAKQQEPEIVRLRRAQQAAVKGEGNAGSGPDGSTVQEAIAIECGTAQRRHPGDETLPSISHDTPAITNGLFSDESMDQLARSVRQLVTEWEKWQETENYRLVQFGFMNGRISVRHTEKPRVSRNSCYIRCARYNGKTVVPMSDVIAFLPYMCGREFSDEERGVVATTLTKRSFREVTKGA